MNIPDLITLPPDVQAVLAGIRTAGGTPIVFGGAVRDALLGRPASADLDVEVHGDLTVRHLRDALWQLPEVMDTGILDVGASFGILKIRGHGMDLDISLPRRDSKTAPGHRGFEVSFDPGLTMGDASGRRDFTVNAIGWDPASAVVHDHHGGLADLRAGVLRHPTAAFTEDPLRVLRGVRFAARHNFTMAPETAVLCRSIASGFHSLAIERVWGEWERIATECVHISAALRVLSECGWETHFPELAALHGVPQNPDYHPEGDVWAHTCLTADEAARKADSAGLTGRDRARIVFAALCHDMAKPSTTTLDKHGRVISHRHDSEGVPVARRFMQRIGAPHHLAAEVAALVGEHMCYAGTPTQPAVRRLARRLAVHGLTVEQWALVCAADHAGRGDPDAPNPAAPWLEKARNLRVEERPAKGLLTGDHLLAAGMKPGPVFTPVLAAALAAQDAGEFSDEAGALRWLAVLLWVAQAKVSAA